MKNGKIILCLFLFIICPIFAQENSIPPEAENINLNRSRLLFGCSSVIMRDKEPMFTNIFFNANYRTSGFDEFTKPFRVNWAFEVGLNGAIGIGHDDYAGGAAIPYVKTGPEMSLIKNLFIGGSFGIASALVTYFGIIPYVGVNSYYLLPLNQTLFVEFELGYHTTFVSQKNPYLVYFASGIAIK